MAKTDMERVGVFAEMGYTTIKDPYTSAAPSKSLHWLDVKLGYVIIIVFWCRAFQCQCQQGQADDA